MSVNEELSEHAEHAKEPFERRVAVTMAVIAAALAIVSVFGHIYSTDEILAQQKASDQWSYYQAKAIRRYESEIARDLLSNLQTATAGQKYSSNLERYQRETDEIQKEAQRLEADSELRGRQATRLHIGEVFLEIGIVFASLAILTKRAMVWSASMIVAGIGLAAAISTVMVH